MDMTTTLPRRLAAGLCALTAACGGGIAPTPSPRPTDTPAPEAPRTPPPSATPAPTASTGRFALLPGAAAYDVRSDATIEMTAGPAAERGKETTATSARVSYELAPAGRGMAVTGEVAGLAVQAPERITGGATAPAAPVRFRGTIDPRGPRLDVDGAAFGCASPAGAAQIVALSAARETVLRVPATVAVGTRWRDTVSTIACRGPIPATVTSSAQYEVTAVEGARVRLRRETTLSMQGRGIAAGRTVSVSGTGSGSATLELDVARGRLARMDGESRSTVTVTLPDGPRQFTQTVRTQVRARDGA